MWLSSEYVFYIELIENSTTHPYANKVVVDEGLFLPYLCNLNTDDEIDIENLIP